MQTNEIKDRVVQIVREKQEQANVWVDLVNLGSELREIFTISKSTKMQKYLRQNFSDVLEFQANAKGVSVRPKMQSTTVKAKPAAENLQEADEGDTLISPAPMQAEEVFPASEAPAAGSHVFSAPRTNPWIFVESSAPGHKETDLRYRFQCLCVLADMALPESWDYGRPQAGQKKMQILKEYLHYTYLRLLFEQKVLYAEDPDTGVRYGAFNTGLVDRKYDAIYALLRELPAKEGPRWVINHFVLAGEGNGKCLTKLFRPLPSKADYTRSERYEARFRLKAKDFNCDYLHMIKDRLGRMPYEFLKSFEGCLPRVEGMTLDEAYTAFGNGQPYARYLLKLGKAIISDPVLFAGIKNRLQAAVDLAVKRQTWDPRTAVLSYNPNRRKCYWQLPLVLVEGHSADCALVVEHMPSGAYQGHTILLLSWAYKNSRYITRPNSDWLRPELIEPDAEAETDTAEPTNEALFAAPEAETEAFDPMGEAFSDAPDVDEPTDEALFDAPEAEEDTDTDEPTDETFFTAPEADEETNMFEPTDEELPDVMDADEPSEEAFPDALEADESMDEEFFIAPESEEKTDTDEPMDEVFPDASDVDEPTDEEFLAEPEADEETNTFETTDETFFAAPETEEDTDTFEPMGEAFPDVPEAEEDADAVEPTDETFFTAPEAEEDIDPFELMDEELLAGPVPDEPTDEVLFVVPDTEEKTDTFEPTDADESMDEEIFAAPESDIDTFEPMFEAFPDVQDAELAADGLVQQALFGEPVTVPEETAAAAPKKLPPREALPEENDRLECGDLFA